MKSDPKWRDVERDEMKAYLGICVYISVVKLPVTQMYWAKNYFLVVLGLQQQCLGIGLTKYHSIFM